jgi:hypothetical protein
MVKAARWLCVVLGVFVSSIGIADADIVGAGAEHTVLVTPDGHVWAWDENSGKLGDGTLENKNAPISGGVQR